MWHLDEVKTLQLSGPDVGHWPGSLSGWLGRPRCRGRAFPQQLERDALHFGLFEESVAPIMN
jgi:hypothetical protein